MKSVLISIRPKWVEKIANGQKTIEVRKSAPKEVPFKCYIYMTQGTLKDLCDYSEYIYQNRMKVIGEFICDKVDEYNFHNGLTEFNSMGLPSRIYGSYLIFTDDYKSMCLSYDEVKDYSKGKPIYGWHISDLKIYDKPKELSEFERPCTYKGICYYCERFRPNGIPLPAPYGFCETKITRAPSNWCYVEELEK